MPNPTERELLLAAAKAAGFIRMEYRDNTPYVSNDLDGDDFDAWNPLADDGDALRLALSLGIVIDCENCCASAEKGNIRGDQWFGGVQDHPNIGGGFDHNSEKPKIMRLAIVRAAASMAGGAR